MVVIGDVSGHDFGATLLMAMTRAYVRSVAATGTDIGEMLTRVNHLLHRDLEEDRFVTLMLVAEGICQAACSFASHQPQRDDFMAVVTKIL